MNSTKWIAFPKVPAFKDIVIILGLCFEQAAAYLASFIWKLELHYYLVAVLFFIFIFTVHVKNLTTSIFGSAASVVVGALIGLGILLIPPLVYGSPETVDATVFNFLVSISRLAVSNLVICLVISTLGSMLSGNE